MVLMSIISSVTFLYLGYLLLRKNKNLRYANPGLILKIVSGLCLGFIYKYHYGGGDTFQYFREAETIANYLMNFPSQVIPIYFNTAEVSELFSQIIFFEQPRALLFSKIISVFYIFSGGSYWIISAFLSMISFFCIHLLVRELNKNFDGVEKVTAISFYFLPTFVFWTSGLLKESLAIGALAVAVAMVLRIKRTQKYVVLSYWIYFIVSSILLWELKYFYAAIAIPLLISLLLISADYEKIKFYPGILISVFVSGVFIASYLHYNLSFSRVLDVVYENYLLGIKNSESSAIHYYNFDGSWYGFLMNSPIALFSGLFRPFIFESSNLLQFLVAIENLGVLILLIIGTLKLRFRVLFHNPYVIAALIYIVSLAILLAYATPNFGTLSRYKAGYWPFFVLLTLAVFFKSKKGQAPSGS